MNNLDADISMIAQLKMANLSLREMMELVAEKGIEMHYTEKDLEEDINAALKE